jgi:hypothetical protein
MSPRRPHEFTCTSCRETETNAYTFPHKNEATAIASSRKAVSSSRQGKINASIG